MTERREKKLADLKRKQPKRTSGRHAFFAAAMEEAKTLAGGGKLSAAMRQAIMQHHSGAYKMLTPEEQL
eukprot:8627034-Lingulodinium_polyedra.AAC.1